MNETIRSIEHAVVVARELIEVIDSRLEAKRKRARDWYHRNAKIPENRKKINERARVAHHTAYQSNPAKMLLKGAQKRSKLYGVECTLSESDIVVPEFCPVLGIRLQTGILGKHHGSPSLDRFDNSKGYVQGNVRVISWRANTLKNDATIDEIESVLKYMKGES